jgi:hypothetical protein
MQLDLSVALCALLFFVLKKLIDKSKMFKPLFPNYQYPKSDFISYFRHRYYTLPEG